MKYLYPLKFDFIELSKRKINENEKKFYLSTIKALTQEEIIAWIDEGIEDTEDPFFTIPIVQTSESISSSFILVDKFRDWLVRTTKIMTKEEELLKRSFYISIDITNIQRDNLCVQLFYYLSGILRLANKIGDIKFFIFQDTLPSPNDILFKLLENEIQIGCVYLIDGEGKFLPLKDIPEYNKMKFTKKRKSTLPDYRKQFKNKLIRKLGHFKVEEKENFCHRYFYDGVFCEDELKILITEFIENQIHTRKELELIIYSAKYSPWLVQSLKHLSIDIKDDTTYEYEKFKGAISYDNLDHDWIKEYQGGEILLICDLICSGDSIKEVIKNVTDSIPSITDQNLHVLSILNSVNGSKSNNKRTIKVQDKEYSIPYFIDVEIDKKVASEDCSMCKLRLPYDSIENNDISKIKSYNFWDLSDKAGYGPEFYGTDKENMLDVVTKMSSWFEDNSAYIVYKYLNSLATIGIDAKVGTIFIYPDESFPDNMEKKELNTPSNRLAESFKFFFNAKEIGIPRYLINKYKNKQNSINDIDTLDQDWINTLRENSSNCIYVIIDEFHRDGKTFESMVRILKQLNRNPRCFFPVINFNPAKTKEYKSKYKGIEILSLYEFNIQ